MSKRKSVWAVEAGEYSDYHVVGIFSTSANADLIAKAVGGSVVERVLDPAVTELRAGMMNWIVTMQRDGTVERADPWDLSSYDLDGGGFGSSVWRRTQAPFYRGKAGVTDCINGTLLAKDKRGAIKRANEIRARLIADGKFD